MALSQSDRIAFSAAIVNSTAQLKALSAAKAGLQVQAAQYLSLDSANKNLFDVPNNLVTAYATELNNIDGNVRTTITEQNIQDAAGKVLRNVFFPNDTSISVPSLASAHNVWTKAFPYALGFGMGKSYSETYGTMNGEINLINSALALISSASSFQDIENTSGEYATSGVCSIGGFTDQASCVAGGGTWNSTASSILPYPAVRTLKTNIVNVIGNILTNLQAEAAAIPTTDKVNQSQNTVALNNLDGVVIPAMQAWLANPDFQSVPATVTTSTAFYSYDPTLLAPTKLHSTQLAVLQNALTARSVFATTRQAQLNTVLGTIIQDVSSGNITSSSGLYGMRYNFLALRINSLSGSLSQYAGTMLSISAQTSFATGITSSATTYQSILPTAILIANGNGTPNISVNSASNFAIGDSVYVVSATQPEIQRSITSIVQNSIILNDVVPAKYTIGDSTRMYKDLT